MQLKTFLSLCILLLLCTACKQQNTKTEDIAIIPIPKSVVVNDGMFTLNSATTLNSNISFTVSSDFLRSFIKDGTGLDLKSGSDIEFLKDTMLNEEAYRLTVSKSKIRIEANNDRGAFYAVQTLRQLMPVSIEKGKGPKHFKIPTVTIEDSPAFGYRGMHLDVGRHMYSVDFIKKYIDALAMLKMNSFHWHLTEDQGWRIEIKKYPKLQTVAAFRNETLVGHYSDQPHNFDGKRYGGFYSQEEIKEVVSYANNRFVTIIPEIEMPGHSQAAIAAYPELGCTGEQVEAAKKWGVFEEVYCPSETTFKFLEDVIDEVIELFPGKYIHIGGDEAPKTRWKNCDHCQDLIKQKGLKDEHGLQSYFIARMERYINTKGKQIIGWDEILEGGLAPNATVMSWRGMDGAIEAAKAGHNVVMTPTSHCYFDYYQSENYNEPIAIGGFLPLEKVYSFNPIPEELTKEESKYVLGAQGNVWTEYMPNEDQVEYMAFPRILAMSEVVWSNTKDKNYEDFVTRVEYFHNRLDALDINYANHLYEIEGNMSSEEGLSFFELKTQSKNKSIRYTTDGTEPSSSSIMYSEKIPISNSTTIKAQVYGGDEKLGTIFTQEIKLHKAVGSKIEINKQPHKAYAGSGAIGLVNGISGSDSRYGDKEWLGFWGEDISVSIDLGKNKEVNYISTRFYNGNGQWIYAPKEVKLQFVLDDGTIVTDQISVDARDDVLIDFDYEFKTPKALDVKVRSIELIVPNYGIIPEGKQGSGNKAWTFIDEIIIN
ncbi:beta-N-acetylhexosaminidase [Winogradskyella alexanderae]|uniref:beta-N-acetylhexosaminidase n=1 Tax=Winogradskyella alexanderae TaxID=2877123 RepID=A0ABS7XM02_9FLAO|nr:family 20 glycosylhydrolase [Winogradskyella alexanderae]MCA0130996.1 family 20 glycosylhydrolase [Winogradskyella alexanderae]